MTRSLIWIALVGIGIYVLYQTASASGSIDGQAPFDDGLLDMGPSTSIPYSTIKLAQAIARAEGFYVGGTVVQSSTSVPGRANNPGDMKLGDVGYGTINGITIFRTATDGWTALYNQLNRIATGASRYYKPNETFADFGNTWANGDPNWANNVSAALGASVNSTLVGWLS